ncbi:MAG: hypothetical protein HY079_03820, partial [Elusimicrobia bacterium]|nr:hypothetical protein [Elusimicrobiota bacterium]
MTRPLAAVLAVLAASPGAAAVVARVPSTVGVYSAPAPFAVPAPALASGLALPAFYAPALLAAPSLAAAPVAAVPAAPVPLAALPMLRAAADAPAAPA